MAERNPEPVEVPEVVERALGEGTFSVEKFVASFDVLVEAAGSSEALRELVLALCVRGRLVPNEPKERAVSLDLADNLQNSSRRARIEVLPALAPSDAPYAVPANWRWGRVNDTGAYINGLAFKPSDWKLQGRPIIRIQNLTDPTNEPNRTTRQVSDEYIVRSGDLLVSWSATLDVFIWQGETAVLNQHIFRVLPCEAVVLARFLYHGLRERIRALAASDHAHGLVMKHINRGPFLAFPFAFPPLAEQKRIVARVDKLMALIDQLEAKQNRKRDLGARFAKASLEALTTAESPQALTTAWTRIHSTWPAILDDAGKLVSVRKAIIALALRGNLLPQASSEGTAEALLQVLAHRGLTVRHPEVDGLPSLPDSWAWVHLGSLVTFGPKNGYSPRGVEYPTKVKSLTLSATTSGAFDGSFFKYIDEEIPDDSDLWLSDGEILIQRGNTIDYVGVAAVFRGPKHTFIYPDLMMKIRVAPELDLDFVHLALNGPAAREFIRSRASGTSGSMPKINQAVLLDIPIPLPPAPEQRRIAARVRNLMKLCDALEAAIQRRDDRATKLAEAVVQEVVA